LSCTGYTLAFTGNNLVVIADDGNGGNITPSVTYPPGFASGPTDPVLNVTNNSACDVTLNSDAAATANTTCLNELLSLHVGTNCASQPSALTYLYFPPGYVSLNGRITPCGNGWLLFGSGPQRSYLRLVPNSAAFNTGTNTYWFNAPSVRGNDNFREFIYNLGFDVGYGNPNATALLVEQNNVGGERNVVIWSEDSNAVHGLDLSRPYPGPALSKNLAIYGFQNAVVSNQIEYSWTFDQLTTEGQTGTVLSTGPLKVSIQHWLSDNTATALAVAANGGVAVIDSEVLNGGGGNTGFTTANGGSLYVRNVTVKGYGTSEVDSGTGKPVTHAGNLMENWTGMAQSLFNSSQNAGSLHLPEEETPLPTDDPDQSNWTVLATTLSSWCSQISGSSSATVYAPPGAYTGSSTTYACSVPDTVNHINMYTSIDRSQEPKFIFTVAGSSSTPLVIDGCLYNVCTMVHTGTRTVVIQDTYLNGYNPRAGAGSIFMEDVAPYLGTVTPAATTFQPGQHLWARQYDVESGNSIQFQCSTCTLWILGLKTENAAPATDYVFNLSTRAQMEIFGSFFYALGAAGAGSYVGTANNSSFFMAPTFSYVNINGYNWQYWVQETQSGVTRNLSTPSQNAGNYLLPMYYSYGAAAATRVVGGSGKMDGSGKNGGSGSVNWLRRAGPRRDGWAMTESATVALIAAVPSTIPSSTHRWRRSPRSAAIRCVRSACASSASGTGPPRGTPATAAYGSLARPHAPLTPAISCNRISASPGPAAPAAPEATRPIAATDTITADRHRHQPAHPALAGPILRPQPAGVRPFGLRN
jgi:hypothetical protein